jgi:hypothetical protein
LLIKRIAATPDHLQVIVDSFASANPSQLNSIGGGLAQAALGATETYATQIQTVVNAAAAAGYWQVANSTLRAPIAAVPTCQAGASCGDVSTQTISPH